MVTFTLPQGLRTLARSQQRQVYDLLFQTSAAALQELAHDPRFVGGQIGFLGVLQTWTTAAWTLAYRQLTGRAPAVSPPSGVVPA